MRLVAVAAALGLGFAATAHAQNAASTGRIQEALTRPALDVPPLPDIAPTFRATVVEKAFPVGTVLEEMWRDIAAHPSLPGPGPIPGRLVGHAAEGVDLLPALIGLAMSIAGANRARAERDARKEVQHALAAFCATHDCSLTEPGVSATEGIVLPSKVP